jgi:RimJ/RimL family protein N-acetyltransferase
MSADRARISLRPLPDRPRVIALEWNLPFHIDMAARLAERHGWSFVYWVGDGPAFGQAVQAQFPGIIFHDTVDARFGRPPAALADLVPRLFDEELAQALAYEQTVALKMMDRIELEESFSYHERVRLFHRMVGWWSALLDHINTDIMIIPTAPHVHYDYLVYALCRRRGIRTAMFENGSIPGVLLKVSAFEEGFPDVVAAYRHLLAAPDSHEMTLSPRAQQYLDKTRGSYVLPHDVARFRKIYSAHAPRGAAVPWYLLRKLGKITHVHRYRTYLRLLRDELKGFLHGSVSGARRVGGHYHGRFLAAGEASYGEDVRHGKWVSERLANLRREHERHVTPADFSKPYVYLPLHVQPERSTSPNGGIYDHAALMIEAVARAIPPGWSVYVKEHPSQLAQWQVGERGRRLSDYAAMAALPNVRLVPLDTEPFDLIDNARAVASITGTSGWEAIARGIPVLCFGIAWYQGCDGVFDARQVVDLPAAMQAILDGEKPDSRRVSLFLKAVEAVGIRGFLDEEAREVSQLGDRENVAALADALVAIVTEKSAASVRHCIVTLRPATMADARILHAWRNDPITLEMSRNTNPVSLPEHEAWMSRSLESRDRVIHIAEKGGKSVGVVRADRAPGGWELSWTVAPEARGHGIGAGMLQQFVASLNGRLLAVVRKGNVASAKIAAAAGLKHAGHADNPEFDLWVSTR